MAKASHLSQAIHAFILAAVFFSAIGYYDVLDDKPFDFLGLAIIGSTLLGFVGLYHLFAHMDEESTPEF